MATEHPDRPAATPPVSGPDPLDELSERVRAAQQAAERVLAQAREEAGEQPTEGRRPPPRGYAERETPGEAGPAPGRGAAEVQALLALFELGRGLVPPELRQAVGDLVRELLLVLRALIDWYLERLEQHRRHPVEVEDIPIA